MLVAEIEVASSANARHEVVALLDNFREAVAPSREYGITLYQATADDLAAFSASSRLDQPGLIVLAPSGGSRAASEFTHRYPARCPACDADLTRYEAIKLAYTIGDGGVNETFSQLDASGLLVDARNVVANGYHSDRFAAAAAATSRTTRCPNNGVFWRKTQRPGRHYGPQQEPRCTAGHGRGGARL